MTTSHHHHEPGSSARGSFTAQAYRSDRHLPAGRHRSVSRLRHAAIALTVMASCSFAVQAERVRASAQPASCTISPSNPTINAGSSVNWSASYSGFNNTPRYSWTFEGGNPGSSTSPSLTVSYANGGTFITSLSLSRGGKASCSTTVTVNAVDSQNPSTPQNLNGAPVSSSEIDLTWSASSDNVGVTGYRVYRCTGAGCTPSAEIGTSTTTSYNDTGLSPDTTFRYRVRAEDAAGNLSSVSGTATAITQHAVVTPNITISDVTVTEGQTANIVVSLSAASAQTVMVVASTSNGTAQAPADYTARNNVILTFNPGTLMQSFTVSTNDDMQVEGTETFNVNLSNASNATIADNQGTATINDNDGSTPNTSINSTSQSSLLAVTSVVPQQSQVPNSSYSVLAINDLGMHCGDLDTRVASILPPFQVLLSQVIQKGMDPTLNPAGVTLSYSAAANPNDPILTRGDVFNGVADDGSTYKTNFWDTVRAGTYDPFYPAYNPLVGPSATLTPLAGPPFNVSEDTGLPVPNVEKFYIGSDGQLGGSDVTLDAVLHAMPGINNPYGDNVPQLVQEHYTNKPFFTNFAFGYVAANVNWFEGAGVPFSAFDDYGRENAYPLVRVQAKNAGGTVLSTVDTVLPISGEASCTNCHADPADVPNSRTDQPTKALSDVGLPVVTSIEDPEPNMPARVSVEWAADINVLRLHDLKHGDDYVTTSCTSGNCLNPSSGAADPCAMPDTDPGNPAPENGSASCLTNQALVQGKPVVCQVCHYTPALDLAQLGPLAGAPGTIANGRNQLGHQSNSRVMHNHHGQFKSLFTPIPAPTQNSSGVVTNQNDRLAALENSCYQCHPGKNTRCLRGAMFNGDMLCSDCHGSMEQVGDDFSKDVSPGNAGAFILADDFYTNASTPRVPWANEPGCGSCHTGDVGNNLAGTQGTVVNSRDTNNNPDGIRLRQAYRTGDAKATPIVPTNKRFAEPAVPASFNGFANPGAGNPQLYRVSTGHGGVMCEGCHGATHAEWPNANPNANDNVTAMQLQGHTGTIVECSTCHGAAMNSQNTLGGPHGMHPVGDNTSFANGGHEHMNTSGCSDCHGPGSRTSNQGTVLSVAKADRNLRGTLVRKGEPVGCSVCHGSGGGD